MLVEAMMLAAMGRLLLDESADFTLQFCRHPVAEFPERLDEKGLAFREGHRQGIEKGRSERIATNPAAAFDRFAGKIAVTGFDMEIVRRRALISMIGLMRMIGFGRRSGDG